MPIRNIADELVGTFLIRDGETKQLWITMSVLAGLRTDLCVLKSRGKIQNARFGGAKRDFLLGNQGSNGAHGNGREGECGAASFYHRGHRFRTLGRRLKGERCGVSLPR